MFRYFLVADKDMPAGDQKFGHWHAIHLGSHGKAGKDWNALVLHDPHVEPGKAWAPFPRVVDSKTHIKAKLNHTALADLGLTGDETTLEASEVLGAIFPPFSHP